MNSAQKTTHNKTMQDNIKNFQEKLGHIRDRDNNTKNSLLDGQYIEFKLQYEENTIFDYDQYMETNVGEDEYEDYDEPENSLWYETFMNNNMSMDGLQLQYER